MTVFTEPEAVTSDVDDEGEHHYFCWCDPNLALCGEDLSDAAWPTSKDDDDGPNCADCDRLNPIIGFRCGKPHCIFRQIKNGRLAAITTLISLRH